MLGWVSVAHPRVGVTSRSSGTYRVVGVPGLSLILWQVLSCAHSPRVFGSNVIRLVTIALQVACWSTSIAAPILAPWPIDISWDFWGRGAWRYLSRGTKASLNLGKEREALVRSEFWSNLNGSPDLFGVEWCCLKQAFVQHSLHTFLFLVFLCL
jgi:hypothetical protein